MKSYPIRRRRSSSTNLVPPVSTRAGNRNPDPELAAIPLAAVTRSLDLEGLEARVVDSVPISTLMTSFRHLPVVRAEVLLAALQANVEVLLDPVVSW